MSSHRTGPQATAITADSTADKAKSTENAPPSKNQITSQMEDVLELLNQRMEGQVSTVQVESAVSNLLTTMGAPKNRAQASTESAKPNRNEAAYEPQQPTSSIQEDCGNYDDSSDDDDNGIERKCGASSSPSEQPEKKKQRIVEKGNNDSKQAAHKKKHDKIVSFPPSFASEEAYHDAISLIPMGKEAAKMMTTFGDGPHPLLDPLELALMGTRKALQVSIMDARKVRRRLQKEYRDAQSALIKYNSNKYKNSEKANPTVAAAAAWALEQQQQQHPVPTPTKNKDPSQTATPSENNGNIDGEEGAESDKDETTSTATPSKKKKPFTASTLPLSVNSMDPRIVYRALAGGTDKLAYAHKCGFHIEELNHLYPEEMGAYQRWNEMHEEYNESKGDDGNDNEDGKKKEGNALNPKSLNDDETKEIDGGHLRERAANFDYRTDKMKNDWYIEYAKVRQGSFLPSSSRVRRSKTEIEWDRLRKLKSKHATGEWENMSARAVRFLHWLGFDPPNLYPPDDETTQALAFLAYDRFGRIIEKAIFLRNEKSKKSQSLWELPFGEQLTGTDIERALEDPDIKPAAVYASEDSKVSSSVQLYFGPGWEDRLELEMEEMVTSIKDNFQQLSEEERMVRKHEMELLTKISAPPKRDGDQLELLVKTHKENTIKTKPRE